MPKGFCFLPKIVWRKLLAFGDGKTEASLEIFETPRGYSWETFASLDATASETFGNAGFAHHPCNVCHPLQLLGK